MGQFFKFMFASMLGFIIGSVVIGLIFLVMIVGAIASAGSAFSFASKPSHVKDNSVLEIKLDQDIMDRGQDSGLNLDFGPFKDAQQLGLNDILADLEKAKTDDRIKGVFLDLGFSVSARMATMKEIRDKIIEFKKESGKPVIAYGEMYTQGTYYIASAADKIYITPEGEVDFRGLHTEMMFFKGLFDKLGIEMQFIRGTGNKYKSFGEVFLYDHMSDDNRNQMTVLVSGLWDTYLTAISDTRKIDKARLNSIADSLLIRHAPDAVTYGLIDGVKYRDEVLAIVKEKFGLPADKKMELTSLAKYTRATGGKKDKKEKKKEKGEWKKDRIAIVYAQGDIMSGESEDGNIGSTTVSEALREAREDSSVKAIVLRVNSPGGSGLASDVIWREVDLARKAKPVVVSMGDLAASGGYYISAAASRIYAEPNTITGSIGVFGMIPNMKGFFNDKLGITFDGVKTNKYAGMLTTSRPLTEEEKSIIQSYIDKFYSTFKQRVADGRHMTVEAVDSIASGRVWTGTDGKRIGLVDEIGGLEDAIKGAAELAKLEEGSYRTEDLPKQKKLIEKLLESLNDETKAYMTTKAFGEDVDLVRQFEVVRKARNMTGIQARMPFELEVH